MKRKPELVKVTITDVKTEEKIKNGLTTAIATVYIENDKVDSMCFIGGADTLDVLILVDTMQELTERLIETVEEATSKDFVERTLLEIKETKKKKKVPGNDKETGGEQK